MSQQAFVLGFLALLPGFPADEPKNATKPDAAVPAPVLNTEIVEFARQQLGEQVRDGECTSLVIEALKAAGAKQFPPYGLDADYVWGEPLTSRSQLRPGDLLQFRDVVFRGRRKEVGPDGNTVIMVYRTSFHHHSAIVDEVREKGKVLVVLHQNSGNDDDPEEIRRRVHRDVLRLADQRPGEGTIWFYRAVPRDPNAPEQDPRPPAHSSARPYNHYNRPIATQDRQAGGD